MTEKPMATRWSDGLAMVRACDEAGVRLFVVKQNRRNRTLQLLKQAVEKGRFGRIYMVNVNVFWTRPQAYYDSAAWRGTWEFDGGAFMNQASHYVDLLDWIVGPVESVMAYTGTLARNIEVEDTGVAALKWRNGAMGSINVTMLTYPKNLEGSITVLGEKGSVRIGGVAVNEIKHWEFDAADPMDAQIARRELPDDLGLRLRPSAVLRQRHRYLARRGRARDRRARGAEVARAADRDVPLGARRQAGQPAARLLTPVPTDPPMATIVHPSAIVDAGAVLGDGCRVWHFVHISAGARIGDRLLVRAERLRRQRRADRQQRQDPEQRLGLRRRDARGRRVLRAEHGVHERLQPARRGRAQERVPAHAGPPRRDARRQLHDRLRHDDRAPTPSSAPARSSTATCPDFALMLGVPARRAGWMSRFGERLDLPGAGAGVVECPHTGDRYRAGDGVVTLTRPGGRGAADMNARAPLAPMEFFDLKAQYAALRPVIDARIQRVLDHGQYIMGPEVQEMEDALAAYTGARHCIAVASGTEALLIALMALGLRPGDEVITTPFTFAATAEMIVLLGGHAGVRRHRARHLQHRRDRIEADDHAAHDARSCR